MSDIADYLSSGHAEYPGAGRRLGVVGIAVAVVLVAGVGGVWAANASNQAARRTGAVAASPSATATESRSAAPQLSKAAAAPSGPKKCVAGDVAGELRGYTHDGGTASVSIVVTNVSSRTCTIYGYGGAEMFAGGDGQPIGINLLRDPSEPPQTVTLRQGDAASKGLAWTTALSYDDSCSAFIGSVSVNLPDDTEAFQLVSDLGQVCLDGAVNGSAYR